MVEHNKSEIENTQPILPQNNPEPKTSSPQLPVKESITNKVFNFIFNPYVGSVSGIIISTLSIGGYINMKTALFILILIGVIIVSWQSVKEWRNSRDFRRLIAVMFLYTILSGSGVECLYALMIYSKPVELRFAYLVPANEVSPSSNCPDISPDAIAVYVGNSVHYTTENDLRIISADTKPLVTAKKTTGGLLINLKLFDSKGKELATIVENNFVGEVADNLTIKDTEHSIDIFDKNNRKIIFHIRYLNHQAIEVFGTFNYPGKKTPLYIEENKAKINGGGLDNNCYKGGLGINF